MANTARKVWAVIIFGLPGLAFAAALAAGVYLLVVAGVASVTHSQTQARVVELRKKGTTRGSSGYQITVACPTLEFTAADGATHRFEQDEAVCDVYAPGDEVSVRYDPDNPSDARIATFMSDWFAGIMMTAIGGLFAFLSFLIMRRLGWRRAVGG